MTVLELEPNGHTCWRTTGELNASIEKCQKRETDKCMELRTGDTCNSGRTVVL